jgi:hypothetical protein
MMAVSEAALDTHPYSGFTTTIELLMVGTPVITLPGSSLRRSVVMFWLACTGRPPRSVLVRETAAKLQPFSTQLAFLN